MTDQPDTLADRFEDLKRCCAVGHGHLWGGARRAVTAVQEAADAVVASLAVNGYNPPFNGDFRLLEGELYDHLLTGNPTDRPDLLVSEAYGRASRPAKGSVNHGQR